MVYLHIKNPINIFIVGIFTCFILYAKGIQNKSIVYLYWCQWKRLTYSCGEIVSKMNITNPKRWVLYNIDLVKRLLELCKSLYDKSV
ncbi:hypothetical protein M2277_006409 [Paenibacillus sp. LBL]|jgi:hypothetical protein|nr:hypothetical protein [Paenibacillus sp. LBL]